MKKVVIHIGSHKTATSSLQRFLEKNRTELGRRGLHYDTERSDWSNHHSLVSMFDTSVENKQEGFDRIKRQIDGAGDRTLLLSSEMLSEPKIDKDALFEALGNVDIRVIGYLRHPCDLLLSAFNEVVRSPKLRWTHSVNELPLAYDPSTYSIFRRWLIPGVFEIAPYDQKQWVGGSIYSDFLSMLGVSAEGLEENPGTENVSLPFAFTDVLRALNATGIDEDSYRDVIATLYKADCDDQESYPLTREMIDHCFERMQSALTHFVPFLRDGFDTDYLFEKRPL